MGLFDQWEFFKATDSPYAQLMAHMADKQGYVKQNVNESI